jgi:glycosyltransferase involved in cell wall biosynthesis
MTPSLSAVLIAKDEEADLPGCLDSLKGLVSEIIVVISDDTSDKTEDIAKSYGAKTMRRTFDDYARMRQASLEAASGEWCLWIDPDERMTKALAEEISGKLSTNLVRTKFADKSFVAFDIPFEVIFLGKTLRWGGLGSESHIRLFRRTKCRFIGGALHEGLEIDGRTGTMNGKITHQPYKDIADYRSKLDRYTTLAAQKRFDAGTRTTFLRHLRLPWEFFARAFLKLGLLDGYPGLVWAGLSAFHSWLKYAKLASMQRGQTS